MSYTTDLTEQEWLIIEPLLPVKKKTNPPVWSKREILLDNGYHPETIRIELEKVYPEILTKIQFELSPKPSKAEKQAKGLSGFVPAQARWVIERSNSWMERCKSLVKNFERTLKNATTKLNLCFVRLMLKRLAIA
jgi:transposase